jgi:hypothetical protein
MKSQNEGEKDSFRGVFYLAHIALLDKFKFFLVTFWKKCPLIMLLHAKNRDYSSGLDTPPVGTLPHPFLYSDDSVAA